MKRAKDLKYDRTLKRIKNHQKKKTARNNVRAKLKKESVDEYQES